MIIINEPKNHKYNCLFLPGMPGAVKEFGFFEDIKETGGKIHWLQYSGTYNNRTGVNFSLESSAKDIVDVLKALSKENLPILVVAYSYSTVLLKLVEFSDYPLICGMALFSPIRGLDSDSIEEDFNGTISNLIESGDIVADRDQWRNDIIQKSSSDYGKFLKKLSGYNFPVMIAFSLEDKVIKADRLSKEIADFRQDSSYNRLLVFECSEGYHRLDSYYNDKIGNFFRAIEIELDLMELLDSEIYVYLWGSSLNYNYSGQGSDIDLLIFHEDYLVKYKELNSYVEEYNKTHHITFDLSINNKSDLVSKKIFRYNRGPVAIHELKYAYFPLRQATEMIDLTWSDIVSDAYNASLILSGESKKILSKCDIKSERVKKIIKYSITVFTYLQYVRGLKNLDLNHVEECLYETDPFYQNIKRSIELKKANYEGMMLEDLYEAVKGIDMIIQEQERLIGVDK